MNKCIEPDSSFTKGYSRKAAVQFFMKEYDKAMETYQEGLKHDENNQELLEALQICIKKINKTNKSDISPEEMKESQAKAMQDLDIQHIFPDHGFPRKPKGSKRYIRWLFS